MNVESVVRYLYRETLKVWISSLIWIFSFSRKISFSRRMFGIRSWMRCIFISDSDMRNRSCAAELLLFILPSGWKVKAQSLSWFIRLFMSQFELLFLNEMDVKYCPQRMARNMHEYWWNCKNTGGLPLTLKLHETGST